MLGSFIEQSGHLGIADPFARERSKLVGLFDTIIFVGILGTQWGCCNQDRSCSVEAIDSKMGQASGLLVRSDTSSLLSVCRPTWDSGCSDVLVLPLTNLAAASDLTEL